MKNKSILRLIPLLILIAAFSAFALASCRGGEGSGTASGSGSNDKYGSFTVMLNKPDIVEYGIALSESRDFSAQAQRLKTETGGKTAGAKTHEVPNYPASDTDYAEDNSGESLLSYTFFFKNADRRTLDCEYMCNITNINKDFERMMRVRIYRDGVPTDYALAASDGNPEPGTTAFMTDTDIARGPINNFHPGDITRFTVVVWIESDDPEYVDNLNDSRFEISMTISVVNELDDPASESAASEAVADPEWESKIIAGVFDSEIYENGKYLVIVFLSDPPRGTDCKSRNDAFLKRYGIEAKDVKYIGRYTATVIIYATRELIEEIAKDRDTVLIDSFVNERPVNM